MFASVYEDCPLVECYVISANDNVVRVSDAELSLLVDFIAHIYDSLIDEDDFIDLLELLEDDRACFFKPGFE